MSDPRYRILLVDDVTRYHGLYEMAICDAMPAKVDFAVNGEEALDKLSSPIPYDLMILDLNMPRMGGEETLRRLRADPNLDTMPVIVLTGDTDQDTHRRLLDIGADDFIEKGASPDIFVARLKAQMRHKLTLDRLTRLAVDMDIFAAGVLHDIRNLETTIRAVCELGRQYLETDPKKNAAQIALDLSALEEKTELLGRYASEIIGMVRETQKPLSLQAEALPPLIDWVVKVAMPKGADPKDELHCSVEGPLRPVVADRHFLQLALLNIVQNAVKYRRPDVAPTVIVRQRAASPGSGQGRTIVTCIEDNGKGIPTGELRKIFEPFVRGTKEGKRGASSGFGLGLSLVQKVVTSMGGRVWAESGDRPFGSTLCIELPLPEASDEKGARA